MKKTTKILIGILCLCPLLLLTACDSTTYYTINVYWSDWNYGSVVGNYSDPRQLEGTTMTLIATKNTSTASTNPFICWIKNNNSVVSTNRELQLTYNSSTAGDYVAVFEETNPSGMTYMSLDNLVVEGLDSYSNVTFSLSYSLIGSSNTFITFENGSLSDTGEFISDNTNVLFLGSAGQLDTYQYRFRLEITSPTNSGTITDTYTGQGYINNDSFDGQLFSSANITRDDVSITLNFEKLNHTMFE